MEATKQLKGKNVNLTEGNILKKLIVFAIPLLLGNLLQQLYNMVDTYVIGQTGINTAYAAVGSVGPITNLLIGFFMGFASGAGVIISNRYGAKDFENVKKAVYTCVVLTLIVGVVFTGLGILLTTPLLKIVFRNTATDSEVFVYAKSYLTIYFAGIMPLLIYNMGTGILRAVGDSRRPFYYLAVATVVNIVLDFLFVFKFNMGVSGVALATIVAQFCSATLTVIQLLNTKTVVKVNVKELKIDKPSLNAILKLGFPSALQMALTSFSNMFVQSYISNVNAVQEHCLGGWTSYSKIDQFIFLPIQSISLALMTFVGQNIGANDLKRAKKGTLVAFLMALITSLSIIIPVIIFAPFFASIFNNDVNVVGYATMFLRTFTPFYMCSCVNQVLTASMRGCGNTKMPMIIMLTTFIGVRQIYLFIMANYVSNNPIPIGFSYPVGWIACCIFTLVAFFIYNFGQNKKKEIV